MVVGKQEVFGKLLWTMESVSKAPEDDAFANLEMFVPDCDGDTYVHKLRKHGKLETM